MVHQVPRKLWVLETLIWQEVPNFIHETMVPSTTGTGCSKPN